jgi:AraC-like DNA-binding protein
MPRGRPVVHKVSNEDLTRDRQSGMKDIEIAAKYGISRTSIWSRLGPRSVQEGVIHHIGPKSHRHDEIRRYRALGWSMGSIALATGVSKTTVSRVLREKAE